MGNETFRILLDSDPNDQHGGGAVADTSVMSTLCEIQLAEAVLVAYSPIVIPAAVYAELRAGPNYQVFSALCRSNTMSNRVHILESGSTLAMTCPGSRRRTDPISATEQAQLRSLGAGEIAVIEHARELGITALLDDGAARKVASRMDVAVLGTIGILAEAARQGLASGPDAADRLVAAGFRATPELLNQLRVIQTP
ncbi:MAG: hypothetical protein LW822_01675 [Phycisphaeraceae bacterium]|jgi:hypothetical protein|nr:hypothetical protein [Phycisphaeraceae bacterium]